MCGEGGEEACFLSNVSGNTAPGSNACNGPGEYELANGTPRQSRPDLKAGSAEIYCEWQNIVVREWRDWCDHNQVKVKFMAVGVVFHAG